MCRFSFYLFFFSFIPYYWTSLKLSRFHTSIRWTKKKHFFACKMKIDANQFLYWKSTAVSSSPNDCCSMFDSIVWWIDTSRVGNNVATITNTADLVEFDMRVIHQNNKSHVLWFQPFHHRKWQWLCLCISFCERALSLSFNSISHLTQSLLLILLLMLMALHTYFIVPSLSSRQQNPC